MDKKTNPVIGIIEEAEDAYDLISVLLKKVGYDTVTKSSAERLIKHLEADLRTPILLILGTQTEFKEIREFASEQSPSIPMETIAKPITMDEILKSIFKFESERAA